MVSEDVIDDDGDEFDKPMLGIMHRQYYGNGNDTPPLAMRNAARPQDL
jgi:hypothetical protein